MTTARRIQGLTLVEVLVAAFIVGSVLVSASWAMSQATSAKSIHTEESAEAAMLAREIHELALQLPTAPTGDAAAEAPGEVTALDTLDGAVFSPPIDAQPQEIAGKEGWTQRVSVSVYDLSDTGTATSATMADTDKAATTLYRLTVTILQRDVEVGTWWWWVNS